MIRLLALLILFLVPIQAVVGRELDPLDAVQAKPLPAPRAEWFNGWQFFGLTKESLVQKVAEMNKALGPNFTRMELNDEKTLVRFAGIVYRFEYADGKITRVRGEFSSCFGETIGAWMTSRQEALSGCIHQYDGQIDVAIRNLDQHRRGEFDTVYDKEHPKCQLACDLRNLRDLYIKRASLRREAGMNISESEKSFPWPYCGNVPAHVRMSSQSDELYARDYQSAYEKAKDSLQGEDRTWWNKTTGKWLNEPLSMDGSTDKT